MRVLFCLAIVAGDTIQWPSEIGAGGPGPVERKGGMGEPQKKPGSRPADTPRYEASLCASACVCVCQCVRANQEEG